MRRGFRKMLNVRSRSEPLIQIADLVAGTILRAVAQGDGENLSRLQHRIRLLYRFQTGAKNRPASQANWPRQAATVGDLIAGRQKPKRFLIVI